MHARQQIRYAVAERLTPLQTTDRRVYRSRVFSLEEAELPSVSVFTRDESVATNAPQITQRRVTVVIEGHAIADESIDDVLDQISAEVEVALAEPIVVAGAPLIAQLQSAEFEMTGDGEFMIGLVRMVYIVPYATRRSTPESLSI